MKRTAVINTVVELLGLAVDEPLRGFTDAVAGLLAAAQHAGTVRPDVGVAETMALLTSTTQGALRGGWSPELQRRTLDVLFAGLRPAG
ncbi:hypothetical protein [Asanoa sp. NPDC050611]|uniref:SbtR family transcriptional regulator n=1 Tax=Asanoa sp. NPDC050611 TaxID=3157098 RepID=UPI0033C81503